MNFFYRLQQGIARLMAGRYGQDAFGLFLLVMALVCSFLSRIPSLWLLIFPAYLLLGYGLFRMFSKKLDRRRGENQAFLSLWGGLTGWFRRKKSNAADRKYYRHFKCPKCKTKLRAPKGKGHIRVTCPSCKEVFDKNV